MHLNEVLQKFSTAQPSSSVAKHKLLRDTKKNNKTTYIARKKKIKETSSLAMYLCAMSYFIAI